MAKMTADMVINIFWAVLMGYITYLTINAHNDDRINTQSMFFPYTKSDRYIKRFFEKAPLPIVMLIAAVIAYINTIFEFKTFAKCYHELYIDIYIFRKSYMV